MSRTYFLKIFNFLVFDFLEIILFLCLKVNTEKNMEKNRKY